MTAIGFQCGIQHDGHAGVCLAGELCKEAASCFEIRTVDGMNSVYSNGYIYVDACVSIKLLSVEIEDYFAPNATSSLPALSHTRSRLSSPPAMMALPLGTLTAACI